MNVICNSAFMPLQIISIILIGFTSQTQSSCNSTLDVVFILDSSGSVYTSNYSNWHSELNIVKDIINNSLPSDSRVGLINFSGCGPSFSTLEACIENGKLKTEFTLNEYGDPNDLAAVYNKVDSMGAADFNGGYTWTDEALTIALNMFNDYSTSSDYKTIVLITDGEPYPRGIPPNDHDHDPCETSTDYQSPTLIALRQLGVHIVTVGVAIKPGPFDQYIECLGQICSVDPVVKHYPEYNLTLYPCVDVFDVNYFTDLKTITGDVVNFMCYDLPTNSSVQSPTDTPVIQPTNIPSYIPTENPIKAPTISPTDNPVQLPTQTPTQLPSSSPSQLPTQLPTDNPVQLPTQTPTQLPSLSPSKLPTKLPTELPVKITTTDSDGDCDNAESLDSDDCDEEDDTPDTCSILVKSSFDVCFVDCYKNKRSKLWNDIKQCLCKNIFVDTDFDDNKKKCYINKYHYGNLVNVFSVDGPYECDLINTFPFETGIFNDNCKYLENVYNWLLDKAENLKHKFDECGLLSSETDEYPNGYGAIVSGYIVVQLKDKDGGVIQSVSTNQSNLFSVSVIMMIVTSIIFSIM